MVTAVELWQPNSTKGIDIDTPFLAVTGTLEKFIELGGQVCICRACLLHNEFKEDQIDPCVILIDAPDVVTLLMLAKGSLQIS